jgi:hypothetical protein
MFIAALFTIAKLWKQPRCSTTGERYTYTMEYYSDIRKNEIMLCTGKEQERERERGKRRNMIVMVGQFEETEGEAGEEKRMIESK